MQPLFIALSEKDAIRETIAKWLVSLEQPKS
jgi:hypothetical protein